MCLYKEQLRDKQPLRHNQFVRSCASIAMLAILALPVHAKDNPKAAATLPAELNYTGDYNGLAITATRSVSQLLDGRWQLEYNISQPLVSLQQSSIFSLNGNKINHTFTYHYLRSILGSLREEKTDVDMAQHIARTSGKKQEEVAVKGNELDKLNCQLQLQLDLLAGERKNFTYPVMNGDEIVSYQFAVTGEEDIDTALGKVHTLKMERVRSPDAKRSTVFWVAPDYAYSIVKITHAEKGNAYTVVIDKISDKKITLP